MNILIYDVAAEYGGAITILNQYYKFAIEDANEDNQYFFVISVANLERKPRVAVLKFPWIKKSWIHRLYFDNIIANTLIKKYHINKIISLQNILIPNLLIKQTLYVHNAIPFSEHKFSFFSTPRLWVYQNLIGREIKKSILKAESVIVQTEWMKNVIVMSTGVDSKNVEVIFPDIDINVKETYSAESDQITFFYPANPAIFKNHLIIIKALMKIDKNLINKCSVVFTLDDKLPKHFKEIKRLINRYQLPVSFVGLLSSDEMSKYYVKSVLVFPSYVETIGLPLLEAMKFNCPIIASSCNYARAVIGTYDKAVFFDYNDDTELSRILSLYIRRNFKKLKEPMQETKGLN